jgi:alkylhydroperoxidase family enzyme
MARIDLPDGDQLEVTRALQLAPHFAEVVAGYERAVAKSPLDRRLHELVRYRIAQLNQCQVCLAFRWDASGVTEHEHAMVADHDQHEQFTAGEQAALTFAELFATDSTAISDDLIGTLVEQLGTDGLVDLTLVIGKYVAMGRFMQVLGFDQACELDPERVARIHA